MLHVPTPVLPPITFSNLYNLIHRCTPKRCPRQSLILQSFQSLFFISINVTTKRPAAYSQYTCSLFLAQSPCCPPPICLFKSHLQYLPYQRRPSHLSPPIVTILNRTVYVLQYRTYYVLLTRGKISLDRQDISSYKLLYEKQCLNPIFTFGFSHRIYL